MARDTNLEIWENPTQSLVSLVKLDHRGVQIDALVNAGRRIHLTPEEREINEGLCAEDKLNPFRNGLLRPIKLTSDPDAPEAVITANAKSDDELAELLKKNGAVFAKALLEIDSDVTLRRLESVASVSDATVKQMEAIKARLEVVAPPLRVQVNEVVDQT